MPQVYDSWSEADRAYLVAQWRCPISAREIGQTLPDRPRTKNAVVGQAHRMRLGKRAVAQAQAQAVAVIEPDPVAPQPWWKQCVYPVGDPRSPDFRYCGEVVRDGGSWCPKCRKIVFEPMEERKS